MREHKRAVDRRRRGRRRPQHPRVSWWVVGAVGVVAVLAVLAMVGNRGGDRGGEAGTPSDPRQVGPIEAAATRIALGRVPLARWVNPTFRLRNTDTKPVLITIPRQGVEVLEGC